MGDKYFPVYSVKPKKYGPKPSEYSDNMMKTNSRATNRLYNEHHLIDRARDIVAKDIAREKTQLEESYRKSKVTVPLSSYRQLETVRPRTITTVTPRQRHQGITTSSSKQLQSGRDTDRPEKPVFITEGGDVSATKTKESDARKAVESQLNKEQDNVFLIQGSKIS